MTTKIFDTSVYVAAFLADDAHHSQAVKLIEAKDLKIILPYAVISEVLTVLTYKHSRELANSFLDYVFADHRFTLLDGSLFEDVSFWQSMPQRVSFADFVVIFTARKYSAELITFDQAQAQIFAGLL